MQVMHPGTTLLKSKARQLGPGWLIGTDALIVGCPKTARDFLRLFHPSPNRPAFMSSAGPETFLPDPAVTVPFHGQTGPSGMTIRSD